MISLDSALYFILKIRGEAVAEEYDISVTLKAVIESKAKKPTHSPPWQGLRV